jgi:hypothetical protein
MPKKTHFTANQKAQLVGFQNPGHDPGSLPSYCLVIEQVVHKWQKLGKLVHGNLLPLDSVVSLIQYRRFPLFCPNSCPKVSRVPLLDDID